MVSPSHKRTSLLTMKRPKNFSINPKRGMSKMNAAFWDKRSMHYDENIRKHGSVYEKTIDRTKSLLANSDVVLDFACASGEMSLDIAPHVQRVHGIDVSGKMIELANKKESERQVYNIDFDQLDAFDPSLARDSFSAILAFNIFHLVDDASKVLARLHDLLVAGGLLISQTPCLGERGWLFRSLIGLAQKLGVAPAISSLTIHGLESLVCSNQFEISETKLWDEENAVQWIVARKI